MCCWEIPFCYKDSFLITVFVWRFGIAKSGLFSLCGYKVTVTKAFQLLLKLYTTPSFLIYILILLDYIKNNVTL